MEQTKEHDHEFPVEQFRSTVRQFFEDKTKVQSKLSETPNIVTFPKTEIDSLVMVDLLIELGSVLGCTLPDSPNKTGGYESVQQLQDDLLPKLEKIWQENFEEVLI